MDGSSIITYNCGFPVNIESLPQNSQHVIVRMSTRNSYDSIMEYDIELIAALF